MSSSSIIVKKPQNVPVRLKKNKWACLSICISWFIYMKKCSHMLKRRKRCRWALRRKNDEIKKWDNNMVLMKLKNEKTKKFCFQYDISFPAWPQKISVSCYRKELKSQSWRSCSARTYVTPEPQGVLPHSPGDEFDIFAYKGLS